MDGFDGPPPGRDAQGRFAAGNPGRPFGSRNRVSKRVARAILKDFEANQDDVLARLREWFIPQYVALVSRLLPRGSESGGVEVDDTPGKIELAEVAAAVRAALDRIETGEAGLAELETAILGEAPRTSGKAVERELAATRLRLAREEVAAWAAENGREADHDAGAVTIGD